jgi:hypothetical protein
MSEPALRGSRQARAASYARFRDAVLDLSDEPTTANIGRYLDASRALDGEPPPNPGPQRPGRNAQRSSE